jgi:PAS domain S-box-containing protein
MKDPNSDKINQDLINKALMANSLHAVFLLDSQFKILAFNELASTKIEFLRGKKLKTGVFFLDYVEAGNLPQVKEEIARTFKGETIQNTKNLHAVSNGNVYTARYSYTPVRNEEGKIEAISLAYLDITNEIKAIQKSEESTLLLDLVFNQSHEGLLVVNLKTLSFKANPECVRIFGLGEEEWKEEISRISLGGKWDPSFPFSLKNALAIPLNQDVQVQILKSGPDPIFAKVIRNEIFHPDGSQILFLSIKDISEEVKAEKNRLENELRFRTIARNLPNGNISIIDKDLKVEFTDGIDYETDLPDFQPQIGDSILNQYGENYGQYMKECLLEAFGGLSEQFELKFSERTYSILITPLPEQDGSIKRVMKVSQNISEEKKAQLEAHYRREYLRQILDTDPNLIYVKNREGRVLMANKSAAIFFGTSIADFLENAPEYFKTYKWRYEEIQALDESIFKNLKTVTTEEAIFNKDTHKMHLFQITRTPFVTEGNEVSILCVGVDITDRVNAENELINQREYLRHILDTDPNLIFVKDNFGKFILVNRAFADYYDTTPENIIGKTDQELKWNENEISYFQNSDKEVISGNKPITTEEFTVNPASGRGAYFVTTKKPLLDVDGNLNILGVVTDITVQKNQEEKVRKSEGLLQEVFNRVADALFLIQQDDKKIVDCNQKAVELLKEPGGKNALVGTKIDVIEVKTEKGQSFWKTYFQKHDYQSLEIEIQNKKEEKIWGSLAANPFSIDDKGLILLRIADITNQKNSEEQIKQNLHEKEILIQEIHHRVKNNMAVISSLLQLQTGYIKDPALIDVFRDSQSRIKSMALIHEKLYQSKTLAKVEMDSYIKELARTLLFTYNSRKSNIQINIQVEDVFLDINSAVPCGLIINEIISNACKHAFKDRDKGNIDIFFGKKGDQFHLEVKDDGIGMGGIVDFSQFKSLGMNLVHALSSQLGANLEVKTQNGVSFSITFTEKVKPVRQI